jgi:DNA polymerase III sliding clamp (beta) subunit (PCNA family)
MLDPETKVTCPVLAGNYPKINDSIARLNFTDTVKIHKAQFVDTLQRMMVMTENDKSPTLSLEFNAEGLIKMLTFGMEIPKTGRMQDAIDIDAEDFEGVFKIYFNPQKLLDAVGQAKADYFMFSFGHENPEKAPLMQCRITTEAGYTCYVMPKQKG